MDANSSCGHHDSTEMSRTVVAKLVLAIPSKLTGTVLILHNIEFGGT